MKFKFNFDLKKIEIQPWTMNTQNKKARLKDKEPILTNPPQKKPKSNKIKKSPNSRLGIRKIRFLTKL